MFDSASPLYISIASRLLINGYSPIYFTNEALILLIGGTPRVPPFLFKQTTMIYLKTRLDTLERGPTIRIANHALRWCRDNLGVNNRKKYLPSWNVTKGYDPDLVGEYDHEMNEVLIYYGGIDDVKELIQTCIHEWTHQLQPITTKYFKYPGSYSRNPYERQAKYNETKYYKQCWNSIKPKLNKNGLRNR